MATRRIPDPKIGGSIPSGLKFFPISELQDNFSLPGVKPAAYDKIGTIQRRLAWPLRKDDTHKSRTYHFFLHKRKWQKSPPNRNRTSDLEITAIASTVSRSANWAIGGYIIGSTGLMDKASASGAGDSGFESRVELKKGL